MFKGGGLCLILSLMYSFDFIVMVILWFVIFDLLLVYIWGEFVSSCLLKNFFFDWYWIWLCFWWLKLIYCFVILVILGDFGGVMSVVFKVLIKLSWLLMLYDLFSCCRNSFELLLLSWSRWFFFFFVGYIIWFRLFERGEINVLLKNDVIFELDEVYVLLD